MIEPGAIAMAVAAGGVFGALYLALAWAGARQIAGSRPVLTFVALAVARAALLLGALGGAIALGAGAETLVAGLAGFVVVRVIATRRAQAHGGSPGWK